MHCTFQVKSKYDKDGKLLANPTMRDCGNSGARFRLTGQLSTIRMTLCEFHRNYVTNTYKWKCEPIQESNDDQQSVSEGEATRT